MIVMVFRYGSGNKNGWGWRWWNKGCDGGNDRIKLDDSNCNNDGAIN